MLHPVITWQNKRLVERCRGEVLLLVNQEGAIAPCACTKPSTMHVPESHASEALDSSFPHAALIRLMYIQFWMGPCGRHGGCGFPVDVVPAATVLAVLCA